MGFQSQEGQIGFATQTGEGAAADVEADGVFARIRSGGLSINRELLIPDPEIGGNRDIPDAVLGAVSYAGEIELYPRAVVMATLLGAALGDVDSATALGVSTHTITPIDSGSLPWLSIEEAISGDYEAFNYTDAKVNSVHFEADANGYLMGTVGLVAKTQLAGITRTAVPGWDLSPLMVGSKVTATFGGVALPAKSFSLDIGNNLEDDDFRLGSIGLGDITEKRRELTGGFTIRPEDSDLWREAAYGSSAATAPVAGASSKKALVITITTYENIGATATPFTFTFTVPKASLRPFAVEPSGDDVIEHDVELQFLRPDPGTPIITCVVKNGTPTVA